MLALLRAINPLKSIKKKPFRTKFKSANIPNLPNKKPSNLFSLILLTSSCYLTYSMYKSNQRYISKNTVSWREFINDMLKKGEVKSITINSNSEMVSIVLHPDEMQTMPVRFMTISNPNTFEEKLRQIETEIGISPENQIPIVYRRRNNFGNFFLFSVVCFGIYTIMKNVKVSFKLVSGGEGFRSLTKANFFEVSRFASKRPKITFKEVAGLHEPKVEIIEFVSYLENPSKYKEIGAKLPRGALLEGPPGCGKTLLAKALSNEANVPFLSMAGSEFIEVVGGVGAARVRDLFKEARKRSPCIVYIDELDAIGKARSSYGTGEHEQTLNQLLVEMDGLENSHKTVIVIASTNRPDILDKALLRRGRFDRHIPIDLPTKSERAEILSLHLKPLKLADDLKIDDLSTDLASFTAGMSGADLFNLCNEAALYAASRAQSTINRNDFTEALEKIQYGLAKKTNTMNIEDKRMHSLQESGRLVVAWHVNKCKNVERVSIVERVKFNTNSTQFSKTEDSIKSQDELDEMMIIKLGGRAAERVLMNTNTSKSQKDIEETTQLAQKQVKLFGMSSLGPISFDQNDLKPYSMSLQKRIDSEVDAIVRKCYKKAENIILNHSNKVLELAKHIFKNERMEIDEIIKVIT